MNRALDTLPHALAAAALLVVAVLAAAAVLCLLVALVRSARANAAERLAVKEHADAMNAAIRDRQAGPR